MGRYRIDLSAKPYPESADLRERIEQIAWDSAFNHQTSLGEFTILAEGEDEKSLLDSMSIPQWAVLTVL